MSAPTVAPASAAPAGPIGVELVRPAEQTEQTERAGHVEPAEQAERAALIDAALRLDALGVNHGKAGNLSVRRARDGVDGFLVTPSGLPYARTMPADIAWMPLDAADERDAVGPCAPSSEWRFHRDVLLHRPEAGAIVHTHSVQAAALACLPRVQRDGIPPFHYMVAAAGGRDIRCARYATFGTQALSDAVLDALRERRACLLAHHGAIALGGTLEAALALAVELEALARMYAAALAVGEPAVLPDDEMDRVLEKFRRYGPSRTGA